MLNRCTYQAAVHYQSLCFYTSHLKFSVEGCQELGAICYEAVREGICGNTTWNTRAAAGSYDGK